VLVKGGEVLEKLALVRNLAFDKTGTLTTGNLRVMDVKSYDGQSSDEVLGIAAALELHSQHLIAGAITAAASSRGLPVPPLTSIVAIHGLGISGELHGKVYHLGNPRFFEPSQFTWIADDAYGLHRPVDDDCNRMTPQERDATTQIWLATTNRLLGTIRLADAVRSDAASAVTALRQMGIDRIALLTGDTTAMAGKIAAEVGISEIHSELLPEQKVEQIKTLTASGISAMIGDGVNDAPAMAAADIGIALGGQSSATAMETADVLVMSTNLFKLPELISIARRCQCVLKQNIAFSLAIKLTVIALAAAGYATMWMAVLADVGASLAVIANGMRLNNFQQKQCSDN
jgi:Cd2+/Zn2+-exporting ATPase